MKALATKPTNPAERLRRGIALVLDDGFITWDFERRLFRLNRSDFDALVEEIAKVVESQEK